MKSIVWVLFIVFLFFEMNLFSQKNRQTVVTIKNDQFYINGKPTYEKRYWKGYKIEGLLLNSRMVQGIFDDLNPETGSILIQKSGMLNVIPVSLFQI